VLLHACARVVSAPLTQTHVPSSIPRGQRPAGFDRHEHVLLHFLQPNLFDRVRLPTPSYSTQRPSVISGTPWPIPVSTAALLVKANISARNVSCRATSGTWQEVHARFVDRLTMPPGPERANSTPMPGPCHCLWNAAMPKGRRVELPPERRRHGDLSIVAPPTF